MKPLSHGVILAGALALAALAGSSTAQQADDGPPLLPGEIYIPGPEDCGVIATQQELDASGGRDALLKSMVTEGAFSTPCEDGLLHGQHKNWRYHRGRVLPYAWSYRDFSHFATRPVTRQDPNVDSVIFHRLGPASEPRWPDPATATGIESAVTVKRDGATATVWAWRVSCLSVKVAVRGCDPGNSATWFSVYAVEAGHTPASAPGQPAKPRQSTFFLCPDPRTSAGCEGVWRAQVARLQPRIDEIMARAKLAEAERMRELDDLHRTQDPGKKERFAAARKLRAEQRAEEARLAAERLAAERLAAERAAAERTAAAQCAATPDMARDQFDYKTTDWQSNYPRKASFSPKQEAQWYAFTGTEKLKMLEPFRQCLGPHFAEKEEYLKMMRDEGIAECARLSGGKQCPLEYPR